MAARPDSTGANTPRPVASAASGATTAAYIPASDENRVSATMPTQTAA